MALHQSPQAKYAAPLVTADGAQDAIALFGDFIVPASLAANDVIEFTGLPPGYVPVDVTLTTEAIGTTATLDIGLLTGNWSETTNIDGSARTCGSEAAAGVSATSATVARMNKPAFALLAPTLGDPSTTPRQTSGARGVGVKVASLSGVITGAKMRLTMLARPRIDGV